jgi:hypothetical protein
MKQRNLSRRQACWTELLADFDLQFDYIRGEDNSVANALSRRDTPNDSVVTADNIVCVAALSEFKSVISEALKSQIVSGNAVDPFCLSLKPTFPLREDCKFVDDLIIIDGRLLIPATGDLQHRLIDKAHICLGHLGYLKTITKLCQDFFLAKNGTGCQFVCLFV